MSDNPYQTPAVPSTPVAFAPIPKVIPDYRFWTSLAGFLPVVLLLRWNTVHSHPGVPFFTARLFLPFAAGLGFIYAMILLGRSRLKKNPPCPGGLYLGAALGISAGKKCQGSLVLTADRLIFCPTALKGGPVETPLEEIQDVTCDGFSRLVVHTASARTVYRGIPAKTWRSAIAEVRASPAHEGIPPERRFWVLPEPAFIEPLIVIGIVCEVGAYLLRHVASEAVMWTYRGFEAVILLQMVNYTWRTHKLLDRLRHEPPLPPEAGAILGGHASWKSGSKSFSGVALLSPAALHFFHPRSWDRAETVIPLDDIASVEAAGTQLKVQQRSLHSVRRLTIPHAPRWKQEIEKLLPEKPPADAKPAAPRRPPAPRPAR